MLHGHVCVPCSFVFEQCVVCVHVCFYWFVMLCVLYVIVYYTYPYIACCMCMLRGCDTPMGCPCVCCLFVCVVCVVFISCFSCVSLRVVIAKCMGLCCWG